jgi:hypothetical protein
VRACGVAEGVGRTSYELVGHGLYDCTALARLKRASETRRRTILSASSEQKRSREQREAVVDFCSGVDRVEAAETSCSKLTRT